MSTWFWVDLLSTIPLDRTFEFIVINSNILKSIKLIRAFKLIRLLKISKLISFINSNQIMKTEYGKMVKDLYKRNRGFLDLFINLFGIVISGHFFTIIF